MIENYKQIMEDCYVVGVHRYCFRAGTPAKVIGVKFINFRHQDNTAIDTIRYERRLVYEIEYSDGQRDSIPVMEININYKLITFDDIILGHIPEITE